jgi:hypothetical protein
MAWRHTVFMTVMALWYVGTPARTAAQDARVTLRVRNDAQVPGVLLAVAKARVEAIYAKAGIDVTFVDTGADLINLLFTPAQAAEVCARLTSRLATSTWPN